MAEQGGKQNEKQNDVGGKGDNDIKFGALNVGQCAVYGGPCGYPCSTDLGMDKPRNFIIT